MNILYINGYQDDTLNNLDLIKDYFNIDVNIHILNIKFIRSDEYMIVNQSEINSLLREITFDLIISSFIGSYISRYYSFKYDIPLISINPLLDINHIESIVKDRFNKEFYIDDIFGESFIIKHIIIYNKSHDDINIDKIKTEGSPSICISGKYNIGIYVEEIVKFINYYIMG